MSKIGEITQGIVLGPMELVAEFEDSGNAYAAKANLDLFLKWCFQPGSTMGSGGAQRATPAVALIVNQSKLDPTEDKLRRSDWKLNPEPRVDGKFLLVDAPNGKHARDVVRKVLANSKPLKVFHRQKGGGKKRIVLVVLIALLVLALGAYAGLYFTGNLGKL